ncbi:MAG: DUF169 domain-containing protein [Nitrospira sp.]|nr:hypothetical protein [Candidatus Manganitrophaceae bacterium]HIL34715.1 hypothetical protein [Candidatus Manganitrophaceae bacterium]
MNKNEIAARQLEEALDLPLTPVALSFCEDLPENIPEFEGTVPAGCSFWQEAATGIFVTSTKDHELCAIGVHTHNLSQPSASYKGELREVLQAMSGLDYVREEEVAQIPVLDRKVKHLVYGPLAELPMDPDIVLLFAHAQQGLIISEAVQRVDKNSAPAMGHPACAVIPQVMNNGKAAVSLGCCGARTYLDALSDEVALWALPGENIEQYCEQIVVLAKANKTLTLFHQRRKKDVASGGRPSVQESLARVFQ